MIDYLIKIRNYCYFILRLRNQDEYARDHYKTVFKTVWLFYYMGFIIALSLVLNRFDIKVPYVLKSNIIAKLILAAMIFVPYYYITNNLLNNLPEMEFPEVISEYSKKRSFKILGLLFLGGLIFMFIPVFISELL